MHLRPSIPSSMFDSRGSIHALWNSMWMALNWLLWSLTLAAAVVLMARRLMGALTGPLSGLSLFFASTTVTLLALVTYRVLTIGSPSAQILIGLGSSAALLLFGAAWSLPATPMAALTLAWIVLFLGITYVSSGWMSNLLSGFSLRRSPQEKSPARIAAEASLAHQEATVEQQFFRQRTEEGAEIVSGWLLVPLAAGQRTANAHVAFCPPLTHMPTFTVEQSTGPLARVKVGQLWPYGARLDLKLNAPAQTNETIRLEFYALSGSQPEPLAPAQES